MKEQVPSLHEYTVLYSSIFLLIYRLLCLICCLSYRHLTKPSPPYVFYFSIWKAQEAMTVCLSSLLENSCETQCYTLFCRSVHSSALKFLDTVPRYPDETHPVWQSRRPITRINRIKYFEPISPSFIQTVPLQIISKLPCRPHVLYGTRSTTIKFPA